MNPRNKCQILFRDPEMTLEHAIAALEEHGVVVTRHEEQLAAECHGGPVLYVKLSRHASVHKKAVNLATGTDNAALRQCDACFEITFEDRNEVLDEINTLIIVQLALQELTKGFMYNRWNGVLSPHEP